MMGAAGRRLSRPDLTAWRSLDSRVGIAVAAGRSRCGSSSTSSSRPDHSIRTRSELDGSPGASRSGARYDSSNSDPRYIPQVRPSVEVSAAPATPTEQAISSSASRAGGGDVTILLLSATPAIRAGSSAGRSASTCCFRSFHSTAPHRRAPAPWRDGRPVSLMLTSVAGGAHHTMDRREIRASRGPRDLACCSSGRRHLHWWCPPALP